MDNVEGTTAAPLSQALQGLCWDMAVPVLVPPDLNPLIAERQLLQYLGRQAVGLDTAGQDNRNPTDSSLSESGTLNARDRSREHPAEQATGLYSVPRGRVQMRAYKAQADKCYQPGRGKAGCLVSHGLVKLSPCPVTDSCRQYHSYIIPMGEGGCPAHCRGFK